ncbi:hypothetical protein KL930_002434 [Ogataea haglerorum]|nr:hypothetical protein KL915_002378 [Ogataea haglerorum]KAG7707785.1 hypothetical protein KL914_002606 [Ogataea haglerorum]KAG7709822.1 hypothetical protein KL950_002041 [Ogataea haglerorum]KAG7737657.1 hypothetical protein KL932_003960 [Ogataea haglerorum]KAG7778347.1 hypothetical protein KL930_002434 [Ogataea haglerorum]
MACDDHHAHFCALFDGFSAFEYCYRVRYFLSARPICSSCLCHDAANIEKLVHHPSLGSFAAIFGPEFHSSLLCHLCGCLASANHVCWMRAYCPTEIADPVYLHCGDPWFPRFGYPDNLSSPKSLHAADTRIKLRPEKPYTVEIPLISCSIPCRKRALLLEAACLMNDGRNHCIIINDPATGKLCGLVTAKDLAFRVVASQMPFTTPVEQIMTPRPYIMSARASANEALRLMVTKKIRHLPLVDDNGSVVGVLNITKCFYHAMIRLEKMAGEAKKLESTFNDLKEASLELETSKYLLVQRGEGESETQDSPEAFASNENLMDLGILRRKQKIVKDLKRLIDVMTQPNLRSVLEDSDLEMSPPLLIGTKTSVLDAVKLLKEKNVTALLVCESPAAPAHCSHIIGILTSKDVAFRVLASHIDPKTTSIARVMTLRPNFADETLEIHTALRLMFEGKFLNLPIKDSNGYITGLVSVLQLTYALLKTLDGSTETTEDLLEADNTSVNSLDNGPAWNRFWGSLDQPLSTMESTEKSSRRSSYHLPRKVACTNSSNDTPTLSVPYIGPIKRNLSEQSSFERTLPRPPAFSNVSSATVFEASAITDAPETLKTKPREVKYKLKIKENLGLGFNNKIYKIRIDLDSISSSADLFRALTHRIYHKVSLSPSEYKFDLGYIDEDGDLISVEKEEDFENATESKRVYFVLDIRRRYPNPSPDAMTLALAAGCVVIGLYLVRRYS